MNNKEFRQVIIGYLQGLVYDKKLDADLVPLILIAIEMAVEEKENTVIKNLSDKILSWEASMGDDDKSLYTLGIRHSIDSIRGSEPQKPSEYLPLDQDYRGVKDSSNDE